MKYAIEHDALADIADAVRETYGGLDKLKPHQIADRIRASKVQRWQRPSDWPDLDSINYTNFDGYYLTYKLDIVDPMFQVISLCATTSDSGNWVLERGHLENGAFIPDYRAEYANRQHHDEPLDAANGNIQLWRVTAKTGRLTCCGVLNAIEKKYPFSAMCAGGQPCVEQYSAGTMINSNNANSADIYISGWSRLSHSGMWMEHDRIIGETAMTNFSNFWTYAINLQLVDFQNASFPLMTTIGQPGNRGIGINGVIDFSGAEFPNLTSAPYGLMGQQAREVDFANFGNISFGSRFNEGGYTLQKVVPPGSLSTSISFSTDPLIDRESLNRIVNALQPVADTQNLALHRNVKYFLTDDQIAEITAKGWTIA